MFVFVIDDVKVFYFLIAFLLFFVSDFILGYNFLSLFPGKFNNNTLISSLIKH